MKIFIGVGLLLVMIQIRMQQFLCQMTGTPTAIADTPKVILPIAAVKFRKLL
jgi:uncharacterized Zn-finger protein